MCVVCVPGVWYLWCVINKFQLLVVSIIIHMNTFSEGCVVWCGGVAHVHRKVFVCYQLSNYYYQKYLSFFVFFFLSFFCFLLSRQEDLKISAFLKILSNSSLLYNYANIILLIGRACPACCRDDYYL